MAITTYQGPLIATGGYPSSTYYAGAALDYNATPGPSLWSHGAGILDIRWGPYTAGDVTNVIPGWWGNDKICVMDQAPSQLSAVNIVAAAVPVAGTPLVLAGASTGITVLTSALSLPGGTVPSGSLVIDGNSAFVQLAQQGGGISMYDPRTTSQRAITFTSVGTDTGATAAVVGYDFYGAPVHQTITLGSSGSPVTTLKTFKYITSITPAGTLSGSNLSVGTSDVYGFGLVSAEFQFIQIYWNAGLISANTGYTVAVATSPATAATGDVRGTYAVQSASDGTKKLQIFITPQVWANTISTLWGVKQF